MNPVGRRRLFESSARSLEKKESQPIHGYPAQAKYETTQELHKRAVQSPTSQSSVKQEGALYHPHDTQDGDNSKRPSRIQIILGGSCLLIILCCLLGYVGIEATNLLSNVGVTSSSDGMPKWSPDGNRIVFSSLRGSDWDIYLMDIDGSNEILLTDDPAHDSNPSWSHNDEQITFASDRDGDWEIFVMDADGYNLNQLTHND